jgi:flagellar hook-associated protein 1 FlgK
MSGLFSIFNIANRGMSTQQKAINVTSHNIANANTEGYSRQRTKIETTRPFGMPSLNSAAEPGQLGTGAQVAAVERVRDSFLDYQVRVETSKHGEFSARDKFLSEIEAIFNEPGDTGISSLIGKFFDSWQSLSTNAQNSNSRTIVVQQSAALADSLNHTANQMLKLKENVQQVIKDDVFQVNDILNQIDKLNQQIKGVRIAGEMPNDLMDRRDLLLDELSQKFDIKIDKKNFEGQDVYSEGYEIIKSEHNDRVKRLSYVDKIEKVADGSYKITYYQFGNKANDNYKRELTLSGLSNDDVKALEEGRVIWTDNKGEPITKTDSDGNLVMVTDNSVIYQASNGELKGYRTVQHDIDNYLEQLNKVAKALVFSVNALHSGKQTAGEDANPFFVNGAIAKYNVIGGKSSLNNLPTVMTAEADITASNISINKYLVDDVMKINTKFDENGGINEGSRALAIAQLRDKLISVQDIGSTIKSREELFTIGGNKLEQKADSRTIELVSDKNGMKIDNYFKDVIDRLGVQSGEAKRIVKNQESLLASFTETRESVSGVSIDEEMASLIQYQHAYQANAKIISTVDELLDVVINGLKR